MGIPLRALMVEDSDDDVILVVADLRRGGYDVQWERVETPESLAAALRRTWDVIISDFRMPHFSGPEALAVCQKRNVDTPFIIVSGTVSEAEAVTAMRAGACDFISKQNLARLCPAVARELRDQREREGRKKAEAQLNQAQKMEAIGQLAGGVAHDFNNILGVIMGHSELLQRQITPEDPRRVRVDTIYDAANRAAALTHQLLAFGRRQVLQPTLLQLNQVIAETLRMLDRLIGENIEVVPRFAPDLWTVKADMSQIEQVLMNLAINARDAMGSGGTLTIETRNVMVEDGMFDVAAGPYAVIQVSDSGHGMEPDTLSHIFEPFFTTKGPDKGTGLGLATVYGVVKQSGGHIEVESQPGQGTTFRVYLPRAQRQTPATIARASAAVGGAETILVLEDERALRLIIREVLSGAGYQVLDGDTPAAALGAGLAHPGVIHLMLTDVVMPQVSGLEAAARLQLARPGVKVLFMSGYTDRDGDLPPLPAPLLAKPFRAETLLQTIRETLDA